MICLLTAYVMFYQKKKCQIGCLDIIETLITLLGEHFYFNDLEDIGSLKVQIVSDIKYNI